jgi:hypothetical protein
VIKQGNNLAGNAHRRSFNRRAVETAAKEGLKEWRPGWVWKEGLIMQRQLSDYFGNALAVINGVDS